MPSYSRVMSEPGPPRVEAAARTREAEDAQLEALMAGIRAGSESALERLTRLFWAPLVCYAFRQLGDLDASADVVQEAFVQIWQRRASWSPGGSPRAYLYRAARSLIIDHQRKRKVRERWAGTVRRSQAEPPPTPLQVLERDELRDAYEKAVAALAPRRREVYTLIHLRGLSHNEVASIMDISPQTVANQMSAALTALRRALEPFTDGDTGTE